MLFQDFTCHACHLRVLFAARFKNDSSRPLRPIFREEKTQSEKTNEFLFSIFECLDHYTLYFCTQPFLMNLFVWLSPGPGYISIPLPKPGYRGVRWQWRSPFLGHVLWNHHSEPPAAWWCNEWNLKETSKLGKSLGLPPLSSEFLLRIKILCWCFDFTTYLGLEAWDIKFIPNEWWTFKGGHEMDCNQDSP